MKHLFSRAASSFIVPALLITLLVSLSAAPLLAAVGLTSFEVTPSSNNRELVITWTTETEVDTIAFRLNRATVEDANVATEVATLPALGAGVGGGSYEHRDPGLTSGTRYYYWLYEVTSSGDVVLLTAPVNGTPGEAQATVPPSATPTNTSQPTATPTQPATAIPTQSGNAPATNTPPPPTNTPVVPNTPVPTSPPVAAAANLPTATDTPQVANTPENPEQTSVATSATESASQESQPAPVTDGETAPASDAGQGEQPDQGQVVPSAPTTIPAEGSAPTGLTSVDTPTAQAVAEANAQTTTAAPDTQPTVVRPTATPRPSQSDDSGRTTGLLAVVGGGSLCAAALLALVAVFIWRRR